MYGVGNEKDEAKISIQSFNHIQNLQQRADNLIGVIQSLYQDFSLQPNKEEIVWNITKAIMDNKFVIR
ncbi:hypothetical protein IJM86_04590 [bacterium]|nr:hypothetical protein [bacterium]